ncbi:hypothetical protein ACFLWW_02465 [Chloroflexota bacterium]
MFEEKFRQWTQGKDAVQARLSIYEEIRDIPYAVVPALNDVENYMEILRLGRGSCMPKHFLLCNMYQRLGVPVLYAVYPFRWGEAEIAYPSRLRKLAEAMPTGYHIACRVSIGGELVLVDATLDKPLKKLGLPVNEKWDGVSDTLLPVASCGKEQIYHPSEACRIQTRPEGDAEAFYDGLNRWLDELRGCCR